MGRDRLKILVCLASEVLIFLGLFFIMSMTFPWMAPPMYTGWVLLFLLPVLLILTQVMMLKKSERKPDIEALCEHLCE